jgi:hypothetical protein
MSPNTARSSVAPARDDVVTALEASCGALLALEATQASTPEEDVDLLDARGHVNRAIELLREAIAELRCAEGDRASALARGFVVERSGLTRTGAR